MNEYKISFTAFKLNGTNHFSSCKAIIHGETFDEAVALFKKEQWKKGFAIGHIVEGDMVTVKFYNTETGEEVDSKDLPKKE
jgi:hypothetical protein